MTRRLKSGGRTPVVFGGRHLALSPVLAEGLAAVIVSIIGAIAALAVAAIGAAVTYGIEHLLRVSAA